MHQLRYCFLVTVVVSMLMGCASSLPRYQQLTGDPSSIATLKMSQRYLGILEIDGEKAISRSQFVFSGQGYPGTYYVTPGKHTILALYYNEKNTMALWILAEAGKEYLLREERDHNEFRLSFMDTSNGQLVGGLVGSADEPK